MTKLVSELQNLVYDERCESLELTTLEKERNLIETDKILKGIENVEYKNFFKYSEESTRMNTCKLRKSRHWRTQERANTFSVRMVNNWNTLPMEVVTDPTIGAFKAKLDKVF